MKRILVADDEETIRLLYTEELSEEGYEILSCSEAAAIMDLIEKEHPDLLILDIRLGSVNVLDLLQEIKTKHRDLPVILCSAYDCFKDDIRSLSADAFVIKGSSLADLKKKIRKILYNKHSLNNDHETKTPEEIQGIYE